MTYLPLILREDVHSNLSGEGNFPRINFRKIAANRNKRLYLFLKVVKDVFCRFSKIPRENIIKVKVDSQMASFPNKLE
jgi:hypothetical protein